MSDANAPDIELSSLRVAIVHYWFVARAGGERVVEALAEIFPQADIFSLVVDPEILAPELQKRTIHGSFLQRIPGARKFHRHLFFLYPLALEQFDLSSYDLVISSESGSAKGVITSTKTCHVCYCHSPMRYIWDMYPAYRRAMKPLTKAVFTLASHYMRLWDYTSAARVDYFVANSRFIASRIRKCYGRESVVIHPPVDTGDGSELASPGDTYLAVGRMVDYKRFDLAVEVCTRLKRQLIVIGEGPEYKSLKRIAGPTIRFLGKVSDAELRENLAKCRALLFPGEEDFGIVPVEAQSLGRPVIAYASGGALETVRGVAHGATKVGDATGVFFTEQSVASLEEAILKYESMQSQFDPQVIREHALQFDREIFKGKIQDFARASLSDFRHRYQ